MTTNRQQSKQVDNICIDVQDIFQKLAAERGCGCLDCQKYVTETMVTALAYSIAHIGVQFVKKETWEEFAGQASEKLMAMMEEIEVESALAERERETLQ